MKEIETIPEQPEDGVALKSVRQRGLFLISIFLWAGLAGALLFLLGYLVVFLHFSLQLAEKLRRLAGLRQPEAGPDLLLIACIALVFAIPIILLWLLWRRYMKAWRRRLQTVWVHPDSRKSYSKTERLEAHARRAAKEKKTRYLRALLGTDVWKSSWELMQSREKDLPKDEDPVTISVDDYEKVAAATLRHIERDIAERAIATGLIVGISQNRFIDMLTIVSASLELQLHVLTSLGKRPSLATWKQLLKRTGSSLFANTYLNREDAIMLAVAVKKTAMGVGLVGDVMSEGASMLHDIELDEAIDTVHDTLGAGGGVITDIGKWLFTGATLTLGVGFSIGAIGMKQIAEIIEKTGDDLLQGVLAGGVIYYHGMAVAADVLALDAEHRRSAEMNRSFIEAVRKVASTAGEILREQIRSMRKAFRDKRMTAIKALKNPSRVKQHIEETEAKI